MPFARATSSFRTISGSTDPAAGAWKPLAADLPARTRRKTGSVSYPAYVAARSRSASMADAASDAMIAAFRHLPSAAAPARGSSRIEGRKAAADAARITEPEGYLPASVQISANCRDDDEMNDSASGTRKRRYLSTIYRAAAIYDAYRREGLYIKAQKRLGPEFGISDCLS